MRQGEGDTSSGVWKRSILHLSCPFKDGTINHHWRSYRIFSQIKKLFCNNLHHHPHKRLNLFSSSKGRHIARTTRRQNWRERVSNVTDLEDRVISQEIAELNSLKWMQHTKKMKMTRLSHLDGIKASPSSIGGLDRYTEDGQAPGPFAKNFQEHGIVA